MLGVQERESGELHPNVVALHLLGPVGVGVGYRGEIKGKNLVLHLGYSHPITIVPPQGIELATPDPTHVVIKGVDKQAVGQIAANIRGLRPPEPYKGKGVKYSTETVRRKAGKTAAG